MSDLKSKAEGLRRQDAGREDRGESDKLEEFEEAGVPEAALEQSASREFGPVKIAWEFLSGGWQLNSRFFLDGQLVGAHSFQPNTPSYNLQAAVGDLRLRGEFTTVFLDDPQLSTYSGDFRYGQKVAEKPLPDKFKGTIASWTVRVTFQETFGESAVNLSAQLAKARDS